MILSHNNWPTWQCILKRKLYPILFSSQRNLVHRPLGAEIVLTPHIVYWLLPNICEWIQFNLAWKHISCSTYFHRIVYAFLRITAFMRVFMMCRWDYWRSDWLRCYRLLILEMKIAFFWTKKLGLKTCYFSKSAIILDTIWTKPIYGNKHVLYPVRSTVFPVFWLLVC